MPSPCDYDDKDTFVSDCISERQDEDPSEDVDQSVAACNSIWDNRDCKSMSDKVIYKAGLQSAADPFEFVMSTKMPDRYGDVVEQDWKLQHFRKNPIALWMHSAGMPIGNWENVRVEKERLVGRLALAARGTSELIDTLWSLVEQRVLRAVSVGFRAGKAIPLDEDDPWGGYNLSGNELLECSLVTIPANPEALSVAKQYGLTEQLTGRIFAEKGDTRCNAGACYQLGLVQPRASGKTHSHKPMKVSKMPTENMPLAEQIQARELHINELRDQMDTLNQGLDLENITDEDTVALDELTGQIERATKQLEVLRRAEQAVARTAAPAPKSASSASPVPRITAKKEREKGFFAMAAISCAVKGYFDNESAIKTAETYFKDDSEVAVIARAATAPATMTDPAWAGSLVRDTWSEFLDLIRDMSIYPNLPGLRLEFDRFGKIIVPRNQGRGKLSGGWVDEGAPIPVKEGAYDTTDLEPKTLGVISSFTKKIANHSMPQIQALVQNQILEDTAEQLDTDYMDAEARTTKRPAGMQDPTETGAGNINAATGATVAAINADTKAMITRMLTARAGNAATWVMSPINILNLRTVQDAASGEFVFRSEVDANMFMGYPIVSSQNIADDLLLLQGTQAVHFGNDYSPNIDVSEQATLVYDDTAPEDIVSGGLATTQPVKSMFQTLSIAVRMDMGLDWRIVRPGGVQVLTGVNWT